MGSNHPPQCHLCGSSDFALVDERESLGERISNWLCRRCGLVTLHPRREDDELKAFYQEGYRETQQGVEHPTVEKLRFEQARARAQVRIIRKKVRAVTRAVDIGCAGGSLAQELRGKFDCEVIGVEPTIAYREYLATEGIEAYADIDELAKARRGDRFDLITMSHVLEHVPAPIAFLRRLRDDLMSPNAILYVEVPNVWVHTSFEPGHLYSFSVKTLSDTLRRGGFAPRLLVRHSAPRPVSLRWQYISVVCEVAPPEDTIEFVGCSVSRFRLLRRLGQSGISTPGLLGRRAAAGLAKRLGVAEPLKRFARSRSSASSSNR